MSNSSDAGATRKGGVRNVPAPPGSKAAATGWSRFIPREELGEVATWKPGSLHAGGEDGPPTTAATAAAKPPPSPASREAAAQEQVRLQAVRQAGYQEGYRAGMAALESFKQSFAAQATAQVGALLEGFEQQLAALDREIAASLTRCAVMLAREVVRSELTARPELVAQVAADALAAVMLSARHISLHVHPADLPLVAEGAQEVLAARGARLLPDPTLERGGVCIASDLGRIDARIGERWAQAAAGLDAGVPWSDRATTGAA